MDIDITRMRKVATLGVIYTSVAVLAACSSGGSSNGDEDTTVDEVSLDPTTENLQDPPNDGGQVESAGALIGEWTLCSEENNLRFDVEYTATEYTRTTGTGTCGGFDFTLVSTGTYSVDGTTTASDGLPALIVVETQGTLSGSTLSEEFMTVTTQLVYTGIADQLAFSEISFDEELPTDLNHFGVFRRVR